MDMRRSDVPLDHFLLLRYDQEELMTTGTLFGRAQYTARHESFPKDSLAGYTWQNIFREGGRNQRRVGWQAAIRKIFKQMEVSSVLFSWITFTSCGQ